jgi:hypothetical protein
MDEAECWLAEVEEARPELLESTGKLTSGVLADGGKYSVLINIVQVAQEKRGIRLSYRGLLQVK